MDYSSESSDPCAEMSTEDIPHYCPSYNVKTIPPFSEKACINHLMTLTCISSLEDVSQQIQMLQTKILLKGQVENAMSGSRN